MTPEFNGMERRLDELHQRLTRLEDLAERSREDFARESDLRDIAERNFEIAVQCCIDIANRIISLEGAEKAADYYSSIMRLAELEVIPAELARSLAPMTGFRNVLIHEYTRVDWDEVYRMFDRLNDLWSFASHISAWINDHESSQEPQP